MSARGGLPPPPLPLSLPPAVSVAVSRVSGLYKAGFSRYIPLTVRHRSVSSDLGARADKHARAHKHVRAARCRPLHVACPAPFPRVCAGQRTCLSALCCDFYLYIHTHIFRCGGGFL